MKTFLIGVFFLGITNIAIVQDNNSDKTSKGSSTATTNLTSINSKYFKAVNHHDTPTRVTKMQNIAKEYNIKGAAVYKKNKTSTYDVVFEESNCKIVATYNAKGIIVRSLETFKNMKLPYSILSDIIKNHPQWRLTGNTQTIDYHEIEGSHLTYTINNQNNKETKTLKFKLVRQPKSNYIAIN